MLGVHCIGFIGKHWLCFMNDCWTGTLSGGHTCDLDDSLWPVFQEMFMTPFEFRFNIALLHTLSLYHCKSVREEKPSIARKVNCLSVARVAHGVASASSASYCISHHAWPCQCLLYCCPVCCYLRILCCCCLSAAILILTSSHDFTRTVVDLDPAHKDRHTATGLQLTDQTNANSLLGYERCIVGKAPKV